MSIELSNGWEVEVGTPDFGTILTKLSEEEDYEEGEAPDSWDTDDVEQEFEDFATTFESVLDTFAENVAAPQGTQADFETAVRDIGEAVWRYVDKLDPKHEKEVRDALRPFWNVADLDQLLKALAQSSLSSGARNIDRALENALKAQLQVSIYYVVSPSGSGDIDEIRKKNSFSNDENERWKNEGGQVFSAKISFADWEGYQQDYSASNMSTSDDEVVEDWEPEPDPEYIRDNWGEAVYVMEGSDTDGFEVKVLRSSWKAKQMKQPTDEALGTYRTLHEAAAALLSVMKRDHTGAAGDEWDRAPALFSENGGDKYRYFKGDELEALAKAFLVDEGTDESLGFQLGFPEFGRDEPMARSKPLPGDFMCVDTGVKQRDWLVWTYGQEQDRGVEIEGDINAAREAMYEMARQRGYGRGQMPRAWMFDDTKNTFTELSLHYAPEEVAVPTETEDYRNGFLAGLRKSEVSTDAEPEFRKGYAAGVQRRSAIEQHATQDYTANAFKGQAYHGEEQFVYREAWRQAEWNAQANRPYVDPRAKSPARPSPMSVRQQQERMDEESNSGGGAPVTPLQLRDMAPKAPGWGPGGLWARLAASNKNRWKFTAIIELPLDSGRAVATKLTNAIGRRKKGLEIVSATEKTADDHGIVFRVDGHFYKESDEKPSTDLEAALRALLGEPRAGVGVRYLFRTGSAVRDGDGRHDEERAVMAGEHTAGVEPTEARVDRPATGLVRASTGEPMDLPVDLHSREAGLVEEQVHDVSVGREGLAVDANEVAHTGSVAHVMSSRKPPRKPLIVRTPTLLMRLEAANAATDLRINDEFMVEGELTPLRGPPLQDRAIVRVKQVTRTAPNAEDWSIRAVTEDGQEVVLSYAQFNSPALTPVGGTLEEPKEERLSPGFRRPRPRPKNFDGAPAQPEDSLPGDVATPAELMPFEDDSKLPATPTTAPRAPSGPAQAPAPARPATPTNRTPLPRGDTVPGKKRSDLTGHVLVRDGLTDGESSRRRAAEGAQQAPSGRRVHREPVAGSRAGSSAGSHLHDGHAGPSGRVTLDAVDRARAGSRGLPRDGDRPRTRGAGAPLLHGSNGHRLTHTAATQFSVRPFTQDELNALVDTVGTPDDCDTPSKNITDPAAIAAQLQQEAERFREAVEKALYNWTTFPWPTHGGAGAPQEVIDWLEDAFLNEEGVWYAWMESQGHGVGLFDYLDPKYGDLADPAVAATGFKSDDFGDFITKHPDVGNAAQDLESKLSDVVADLCADNDEEGDDAGDFPLNDCFDVETDLVDEDGDMMDGGRTVKVTGYGPDGDEVWFETDDHDQYAYRFSQSDAVKALANGDLTHRGPCDADADADADDDEEAPDDPNDNGEVGKRYKGGPGGVVDINRRKLDEDEEIEVVNTDYDPTGTIWVYAKSDDGTDYTFEGTNWLDHIKNGRLIPVGGGAGAGAPTAPVKFDGTEQTTEYVGACFLVVLPIYDSTGDPFSAGEVLQVTDLDVGKDPHGWTTIDPGYGGGGKEFLIDEARFRDMLRTSKIEGPVPCGDDDATDDADNDDPEAEAQTYLGYALFIGDGALSAAGPDADQLRDLAESFGEDAYEIVELNDVPEELWENLKAQGTSTQHFDDGYDAAQAAVPYMGQTWLTVEPEGSENEDDDEAVTDGPADGPADGELYIDATTHGVEVLRLRGDDGESTSGKVHSGGDLQGALREALRLGAPGDDIWVVKQGGAWVKERLPRPASAPGAKPKGPAAPRAPAHSDEEIVAKARQDIQSPYVAEQYKPRWDDGTAMTPEEKEKYERALIDARVWHDMNRPLGPQDVRRTPKVTVPQSDEGDETVYVVPQRPNSTRARLAAAVDTITVGPRARIFDEDGVELPIGVPLTVVDTTDAEATTRLYDPSNMESFTIDSETLLEAIAQGRATRQTPTKSEDAAATGAPTKWSCGHKRVPADKECSVCKAFGRKTTAALRTAVVYSDLEIGHEYTVVGDDVVDANNTHVPKGTRLILRDGDGAYVYFDEAGKANADYPFWFDEQAFNDLCFDDVIVDAVAPAAAAGPAKWSCGHKRQPSDKACPVCKAFGRKTTAAAQIPPDGWDIFDEPIENDVGDVWVNIQIDDEWNSNQPTPFDDEDPARENFADVYVDPIDGKVWARRPKTPDAQQRAKDYEQLAGLPAGALSSATKGGPPTFEQGDLADTDGDPEDYKSPAGTSWDVVRGFKDNDGRQVPAGETIHVFDYDGDDVYFDTNATQGTDDEHVTNVRHFEYMKGSGHLVPRSTAPAAPAKWSCGHKRMPNEPACPVCKAMYGRNVTSAIGRNVFCDGGDLARGLEASGTMRLSEVRASQATLDRVFRLLEEELGAEDGVVTDIAVDPRGLSGAVYSYTIEPDGEPA